MLTSRRRSFPARSPRASRRGSRLVTVLAMGAAATLAAAPLAAAQSTAEADGTIAVSSLGSTTGAPGSTTGSLGPFGSLAAPAYAEYVALGDSYAAFGDQTKATPAPCAQSLSNYPHVLDANPAVGDLVDVTCGGAIASDMFTERHEGVPPQLDALTEGTDLVTLSIGGNDVGFGQIVQCIMSGTVLDEPLDCEATMGPQVATAIATAYGPDGPVDDIYDAIEDAAPDATVIATQYMPLMPADDADKCPLTFAIGQDNLDWSRQITADINNAVTAAAERNGAISVMPTAEGDHSACAGDDQRWTDFLGGAPTNAAPFHPTPLGQQAMAAAIAAAI